VNVPSGSKILRDLQTEDGQRTLNNIRVRRQRFEPEMEAKEGLLVLAGQGARIQSYL
jgi:hypothetical protein